MNRNLVVAATGHRAKDITEPFGAVIGKAETKLRYAGAKTFICGMADGFDLLAAEAAMDLGLEVWAVRPWTNHTATGDWMRNYVDVMDYASRVEVVVESDTYPGHWCMHARNKWMVDNADVVMAYLNPEKQTGGTFATVKYAKGKKPVANIYLDPPF